MARRLWLAQSPSDNQKRAGQVTGQEGAGQRGTLLAGGSRRDRSAQLSRLVLARPAH